MISLRNLHHTLFPRMSTGKMPAKEERRTERVRNGTRFIWFDYQTKTFWPSAKTLRVRYPWDAQIKDPKKLPLDFVERAGFSVETYENSQRLTTRLTAIDEERKWEEEREGKPGRPRKERE